MKIYQEVLNALHAEAQGILEMGGFDANTLVLHIRFTPSLAVCFEALAARSGASIRRPLITNGEARSAQQFLDLLRERVAAFQPQTV